MSTGLFPAEFLQLFLGRSIEQFNLLEIDLWIRRFQVFASFVDSASTRSSKRNHRLPFEIIAFHEGVDNSRTSVPPNWETNIDYLVLIHVREFVSIQSHLPSKMRREIKLFFSFLYPIVYFICYSAEQAKRDKKVLYSTFR